MIDVKKATQIAASYFNDFYADQNFVDVLLEEVEFDEENAVWKITLGYFPQPITVFPESKPRRYKLFNIDAETGKVKSMKIRWTEHA